MGPKFYQRHGFSTYTTRGSGKKIEETTILVPKRKQKFRLGEKTTRHAKYVILSLGFANSNCRLKVGAPPKIEYMPKELHLPEGDNSKIKIKWSGDLPVDIEIVKNGQKVTESGKFKITTFDEFLIIFLREITQDIAGR